MRAFSFERLESRFLCSSTVVGPARTGPAIVELYFQEQSILNATPTGAELLLFPLSPVNNTPPGVQIPPLPGEQITGVGSGVGGGGGSSW